MAGNKCGKGNKMKLLKTVNGNKTLKWTQKKLKNCELYLSLLSASAQNENWNHSENIKWGIRKRAKDGTSHLYNRPCYGYRLNEEGELEIIPNEALIVRKIYSLYIDGMSVIKIKQYLESNNVPSPTGKETWSKHTIETILTNKKYIGISVLYKTYKSEYPYSKRMVNFGKHDMYKVSEHHIPIIPEELFEMAQKVRADRTNVEKDEIGNTQRKAKKYTAAGLKIVDEDGRYYIKKKE